MEWGRVRRGLFSCQMNIPVWEAETHRACHRGDDRLVVNFRECGIGLDPGARSDRLAHLSIPSYLQQVAAGAQVLHAGAVAQQVGAGTMIFFSTSLQT